MRIVISLPVEVAPAALAELSKYATRQAFAVSQLQQRLEAVLNGQLTFGDGKTADNMLGAWVTFVVAAGNVQQTLVHNLGVVPVGFLVVKPPDKGAVNTGADPWTTSTISVVCSGSPGTLVTLFVLSPPQQEI